MLAKVLKSQLTAGFAPFVIPAHGHSNSYSEGVAGFAFPAIGDFFPALETERISESQPSPEFAGGNVYENILESARREAAALIDNAEAHSQTIEQAAAEKGLLAANQIIAAEVAEKVAGVRQQLTATIESIANLRTDIAAQAETEMVRLALEIARKIVGREVKVDPEIAVTLARVALGRLNNRAVAAVHLSPEDFAYVTAHRAKLEFHGSLELVADHSIEPGGCLVRTATGDVDARIESQFAEISSGLLG